MSKNPARNYAIQWLQGGQTKAQAAAAAASVPATTSDATGTVYGDVSGSLLGPLVVTGILGSPIDGPAVDGDVLQYDLASDSWVLAPNGGFDGIAEHLTTAETDTTKRLAPDGAGGVDWVAETGGLVVEDEGTPLATDASTLNFVGAGVTASGSGATKTITIRGGSDLGWFNVKDYGAVGDDSTDDTTAIQNAINATPTGGVCYFPLPSVAYKITSALSVPHQMTLRGDMSFIGQYTKIHQATANTDAIVGPSTSDHHLVVEGLQITGTIGGQSSGAGIKVNNSVLVSRCLIQGFYDGLRITSASPTDAVFESSVEFSFFDSATRAGIALIGIVNNFGWFDCRVNSNAYGVYIPGISGGTGGGAMSLRFIGGAIELNTTAGIWMDGDAGGTAQVGVGLNMTGVYLEQNDTIPDIVLGTNTTVYATTVIGCSFVKSGLTGTGKHLDANHVNGVTMIGNEFQSSSTPCVSVNSSNGSNVVLTNNHYRNGGTSSLPSGAIEIDNTSTTPSAIGTAAAGTSTKIARVDHVHATGAGTPSTQAIGDAAATGSGPAAAMTDHKHAMPSFASPTIALGSAAASGSAATLIRSDATIAAFDSTAPLADGAAAATGSSAFASRADHVHPAESSSGGLAFTIIGQETRTSDGSTTSYNLDNDFEANSVQAFNLTSGKALTVTEGTSPAVTIGAAGTAGDVLSFAYAASAI